jgi:uncharacterized protein YukE
MLPEFHMLAEAFRADLKKVKAEPVEYAAALDEIADDIREECDSYMEAEGITDEDLDGVTEEEDEDPDFGDERSDD